MNDVKVSTEVMASSDSAMVVVFVSQWGLRISLLPHVLHEFTSTVWWVMHANGATAIPCSSHHHWPRLVYRYARDAGGLQRLRTASCYHRKCDGGDDDELMRCACRH